MMRAEAHQQERKQTYTVGDDEEGEEVSNEVPIQRKAQKIRYRDVLTPEWFDLGDVLRWLAKQVGVEEGGRAQGAVGHVGETLWDAEGEHRVCKTIVDLAKVSVLLRLMHDYMRWRVDEVRRGEDILALTRSLAGAQDDKRARALGNEGTVVVLCDEFEESLGMLLGVVLRWKEAMQLSEPRVLIQHIALVLSHAPLPDEEPSRVMARQSHMCYYYFQSLGRFIEDLATAELLADMQTQRLIPLVVEDLHRRSALGPEAAVTVQLGLAGLSALAEAEDFQTDWQAHFELPEDLRQFVALEAVVQEHVARTPDLRRELRPLTDLLNRAKRAAK